MASVIFTALQSLNIAVAGPTSSSSMSTSSVASASSKLISSFSLRAAIVSRSMNSKRWGCIFEDLNLFITSPVVSQSSKVTRNRLIFVVGMGMIFRHASVTMARTPSLPTIRWTRSKPALFFASASPKRTVRPFGRTTLSATTQSFMVPYLTHLRPPEPSAIAPPTVHM